MPSASLAAVAGIAPGVLIGQSQIFLRALDPIFQVLRTVPPLAWLPLALAAFRDGQPSAIFVIFITSIWPILINTSVGVRNIPDDYRNIARIIRLSPLEYFYKIMLPATVPHMFTGLRIGIGLSWLAIIAAEMLTGGVGIGFFIWDAWNSSLISDIVAALLCRHRRLPPRPAVAHRLSRRPRQRQVGEARAMHPYLSIEKLGVTFCRGAIHSEVLREISLSVAKGEFIAIIGHPAAASRPSSTSSPAWSKQPTAGSSSKTRRLTSRDGPPRLSAPFAAAVADGLRKRPARRR